MEVERVRTWRVAPQSVALDSTAFRLCTRTVYHLTSACLSLSVSGKYTRSESNFVKVLSRRTVVVLVIAAIA